MQTIDKYNKLILSKLPVEITKELDEIKTSTNNFQDEELLAVFQENFNSLYEIVEKKYPDAIKAKMKLKALAGKPKLKQPEKKSTSKKSDKRQSVFTVEGKEVDLSKEQFPENHPLMILDTDSPQFKEALKEFAKGGSLKEQMAKITQAASLPAIVGAADDCEEAIEELTEIKEKKAAAAEKRAKTIKKTTRSERIKGHIGKAFISIKKADKESKYSEQIEKLEKFHMITTAHLLRFIRKNDISGIDKLVKLSMEESKI